MLSLALGIGANIALFSVVDDLLIRSLPVNQPDRLVQVQQTVQWAGIRKRGFFFSTSVFDYVRLHNHVFSEIVGFKRLDRPAVDFDGAAEPSRQVEQVSENFFRDLGLTPIVGRTPEPSGDPVAVISYGLWHARFGGSPKVLGRVVTVNDHACTIIGVAPPRRLSQPRFPLVRHFG